MFPRLHIQSRKPNCLDVVGKSILPRAEDDGGEVALLAPVSHSRMFRKCSGRDVPNRSVGRARYRCVFVDCAYICPSVARLRVHEKTNQKKYARWYCCPFNTRISHRVDTRYRCDIFGRSFARACLLKQHKDNEHAHPPLDEKLRMYGLPRIGKPCGRSSRRLVKQGALPIGMRWEAKEEVRAALCIANAAIPDVCMIRDKKWRGNPP